MTDFKTKVWRLVLGEPDIKKVIRVKCWIPFWDNDCMHWPTILVDLRGQRLTITPWWTRYRFIAIFKNIFKIPE